jgi:hypothetical protein
MKVIWQFPKYFVMQSANITGANPATFEFAYNYNAGVVVG